MGKELVLVHTVSSLVNVFTKLAKEIIPSDVKITHIADEILLKDLIRHGEITPFIIHHFSNHAIKAEQFGANAVLLTCSSIAPSVNVAQQMVNIPVIRIDEAMVSKAISTAKSIGVLATAPTAVKPLTDFLYYKAASAKKTITVDSELCNLDAYNAMLAGNMEVHDRIVRDSLKKMIVRNDIVLLAQGSMSRVLNIMPDEEKTVPIISSPRLALLQIRKLFT